jgi:hypothetical protein
VGDCREHFSCKHNRSFRSLRPSWLRSPHPESFSSPFLTRERKKGTSLPLFHNSLAAKPDKNRADQKQYGDNEETNIERQDMFLSPDNLLLNERTADI